jgi:hypothetical protein
MPIKVPCPKCGKSLRAPDAAAGKKARCPACKTVVQLPGAAAVAAVPLVAAEPDPAPSALADAFAVEQASSRPPAPQPGGGYDLAGIEPASVQAMPAPLHPLAPVGGVAVPRAAAPSAGGDSGWGVVRGGLLVIFIGLLLITLSFAILVVFSLIVQMVGWLITSGTVSRETVLAWAPTIGYTALGALWTLAVSPLALAIGTGLCCAAPSGSGARPLAIASAACWAAVILLMLMMAGTVAAAFGRMPTPATAATLILGLIGVGLLSLGAVVVLILFVWKASLALGRPDVAKSAIQLLVYAICVGVLSVALVPVIASSLRQSAADADTAKTIVRVVSWVLILVGLIWFIRIVRATSNASLPQTGRRR